MELTTETLAGDVTKVNLAGKLDIAGAQKIDLHFSVLVGSHRKLIVDLEQVSFLASMGIRTLIMGAKTVKSKGGRMSILRPTPDVERVLIACGADTLIPMTHNLEAALAAVTA